MILSRSVFRDRTESHSQSRLLEAFGLPPVGGKEGEHNALFDAENLRRLSLEFAKSVPSTKLESLSKFGCETAALLCQDKWHRSFASMLESLKEK